MNFSMQDWIPEKVLCCSNCQTLLATVDMSQHCCDIDAPKYDSEKTAYPITMFQCDLCPQLMSQRGNLKTHRYSLGQKPYICPHLLPSRRNPLEYRPCPRTFADPSGLLTHRKRIHGYKPAPREPRKFCAQTVGLRHTPYQRISPSRTKDETSNDTGSAHYPIDLVSSLESAASFPTADLVANQEPTTSYHFDAPVPNRIDVSMPSLSPQPSSSTASQIHNGSSCDPLPNFSQEELEKFDFSQFEKLCNAYSVDREASASLPPAPVSSQDSTSVVDYSDWYSDSTPSSSSIATPTDDSYNTPAYDYTFPLEMKHSSSYPSTAFDDMSSWAPQITF
ncbi:hypothetical protein BC835DRAFT_134925 [Cytidiella melzeri]|nr:hypothetical protein BC835DRAFT_134925 [Cytidiella melzeri]